MKVKITKKEIAATDILVFELAATGNEILPAFSAGSHIDVHVAPKLSRSYSLCNNPTETHRYMIAILREPNSRGGSVAMHALNVGDELDITEPKNHFALERQAEHSILLAGGIGVTPILSMAERLAHIGASFEMHYCTRSQDRTAFRERLALPDLGNNVRIYFDDAPPSEKIDFDTILRNPGHGRHVYVCGPGGFIEVVLARARQLGWPDAQVHREYFNAVAQADVVAESFQVKIASTGKLINVPADKSIVEALSAHGIDIETSCEQGVCGTCLTRVLSGEPDHRDLYLSDDERSTNDQMLTCCSRSKTPILVLDL
jgi:vanillate O-demethylase ferredoxin subunit